MKAALMIQISATFACRLTIEPSITSPTPWSSSTAMHKSFLLKFIFPPSFHTLYSFLLPHNSALIHFLLLLLYPLAFLYSSIRIGGQTPHQHLFLIFFFIFFFLGVSESDDDTRMTTMAGSNNTRLHLIVGNLRKPESENVIRISKVGDDVWSRKREVRSLCVKGSSSYQSTDRINGNANGVNGAVAPFAGKSIEWKNDTSLPVHNFMLGRFVEDRFVYRQTFVIRSYEIGPDKTATMETLLNLLQVSTHLQFDSFLFMNFHQQMLYRTCLFSLQYVRIEYIWILY